MKFHSYKYTHILVPYVLSTVYNVVFQAERKKNRVFWELNMLLICNVLSNDPTSNFKQKHNWSPFYSVIV